MCPWKLRPLGADTAGGWAKVAAEVLHKCAERVDRARRGVTVSLWRQRLSVALQKAGCRILRKKVAAALGTFEVDGDAGAVWELAVHDVDCIPGAPLAPGPWTEE